MHKKQLSSSFLEKVQHGLEKCGIMPYQCSANIGEQPLLRVSPCVKPSLLLAVSGGIDSMVMLYAIYILTKKYNFTLFVITVNHNLRSKKETDGDALFVHQYCTEKLHIPCVICTVPPGKIKTLATKRLRGIEDAARHIRYELIKNQAQEYATQYILFAHNRNDHLETIVQHFLQGATAGISGTACAGIQQTLLLPLTSPHTKDKTPHAHQTIEQEYAIVARPLLDIPRSEIESYAHKQNIPFCEDSTNEDIVYYRNRLRHKIIPVLDEFFLGWDTGVLAGAEKSRAESTFIEKLADTVPWEKKDGAQIPLDQFFAQGFPVRIRILYRGFAIAGLEGRIPYKMVQAAAMGQKRVQGKGLEIVQKANYLVIRPIQSPPTKNIATVEPYTLEVTKCGRYSIPGGIITVSNQVQKTPLFTDNYIGEFFLPLYIRSKRPGDKILTASGGHKLLKKIWNEWRVQPTHRHSIPIIQQDGQLAGIWGSPYGYPNWYVQQHMIKKQGVFLQFTRNKV